MCDDHSGTPLRVFIPARLSYTEADRWDTKGIDTCIAPLVKALNEAGMVTIASCCGHGHRPGNIVLDDGREVIIARSYEEGRQIDGLFPLTCYGERVMHE